MANGRGVVYPLCARSVSYLKVQELTRSELIAHIAIAKRTVFVYVFVLYCTVTELHVPKKAPFANVRVTMPSVCWSLSREWVGLYVPSRGAMLAIVARVCVCADRCPCLCRQMIYRSTVTMGIKENNLNGGASKASNPGKRPRVTGRASTDAYQLRAGPTAMVSFTAKTQ